MPRPRKRARWSTDCSHLPIPSLPRTLRAIELAYGKHWAPDESYDTAAPLTAADLRDGVRARLLERATVRAKRIRAAERILWRDLFWLRQELAVTLARLDPAAVRRWRDTARWSVDHAERILDYWRQVQALVLAHEPAMDQWLRRQLGTLRGLP